MKRIEKFKTVEDIEKAKRLDEEEFGETLRVDANELKELVKTKNEYWQLRNLVRELALCEEARKRIVMHMEHMGEYYTRNLNLQLMHLVNREGTKMEELEKWKKNTNIKDSHWKWI